MKNLLILSASVGAGHDRAAAALDAVCRERYPERFRASWLDSLALSPLARAVYAGGYRLLADRAPRVLDRAYEASYEKTGGSARAVADRAARLLLRPLRRYVANERPEVIVCTHFLPAAALAGARLPPPHLVITDHDCHAMWMVPGIAGYFVADDGVRELLVRRGVNPAKVTVTGVPIDPAFAATPDRAAIRAALGLGERSVVLLLGGTIGAPATRLAFAALRKLENVLLLVVCGRNAGLYRALAPFSGGRTRVLGFRQDMADLMTAADVMVSKAGGITISEALTKRLPTVVFGPLPGQEEQNARYAVDAGAAVLATSPASLAAVVADLLADPARREQMARCAQVAARPDAARVVLQELGKSGALQTGTP